MYDTSDRDGFMASHGQGLIETNSGEGHNSNSPLGQYTKGDSPSKTGSNSRDFHNARNGRLLEPIFQNQNRMTTTKNYLTKSGGMSAMTTNQAVLNNEQMHKSQNL